MSIGLVFGFLAIASGFTTQISVAALTWTDLNVFIPPPPPVVDSNNITYVHDAYGGLHKVTLDKMPKESVTYFSAETDVIFELYTPENPTEPQILQFNNITSVKESNFNWKIPTRILIHGWYSEGVLTEPFAEAYLVKGNHKVNFIAVNWRRGADTVNYFYARRRVNEVGEHVAKFVDFMYEKAWMKISDLTIVGHSLGAHASGIAGKKITKGKVGKIVGLDPASPLFKYKDVNDRLAETDASYVEVIHTCAGTLGFTQPIGTASFYPNGGKSQPGCGWDVSGACAHRRSYEFYIESIITPHFFAFECETFESVQKGNCSIVNEVIQMGGEPGNREAKGIFYLQTNSQPVFARGRRGILQAILKSKKKKSVTWILKNLFRGETLARVEERQSEAP